MSGANPNFIGLIILRGLTLLVGLAFAWMGYRLFALRMTKQAGDLEVQAGKGLVIKLTRAAPGVFFALFGAAIIIYSVTRVLEMVDTLPAPTPTQSSGKGGNASKTGPNGQAQHPDTPASPPAKTGGNPGSTFLCDSSPASCTPPKGNGVCLGCVPHSADAKKGVVKKPQ